MIKFLFLVISCTIFSYSNYLIIWFLKYFFSLKEGSCQRNSIEHCSCKKIRPKSIKLTIYKQSLYLRQWVKSREKICPIQKGSPMKKVWEALNLLDSCDLWGVKHVFTMKTTSQNFRSLKEKKTIELYQYLRAHSE